jgi:hypothetical protein
VDGFKQGAIFVPVYSISKQNELWDFLASFDMEDARIFCEEEYCLAELNGRILRVYKFLNLLEYENEFCEPATQTGIAGVLWDIGNIEAGDIAPPFLHFEVADKVATAPLEGVAVTGAIFSCDITRLLQLRMT